jgi:hypothetical protein
MFSFPSSNPELVWLVKDEFTKNLILCGKQLGMNDKGNVNLVTNELTLNFLSSGPTIKDRNQLHFTLKIGNKLRSREIPAIAAVVLSGSAASGSCNTTSSTKVPRKGCDTTKKRKRGSGSKKVVLLVNSAEIDSESEDDSDSDEVDEQDVAEVVDEQDVVCVDKEREAPEIIKTAVHVQTSSTTREQRYNRRTRSYSPESDYAVHKVTESFQEDAPPLKRKAEVPTILGNYIITYLIVSHII